MLWSAARKWKSMGIKVLLPLACLCSQQDGMPSCEARLHIPLYISAFAFLDNLLIASSSITIRRNLNAVLVAFPTLLSY